MDLNERIRLLREAQARITRPSTNTSAASNPGGVGAAMSGLAGTWRGGSNRPAAVADAAQQQRNTEVQKSSMSSGYQGNRARVNWAQRFGGGK